MMQSKNWRELNQSTFRCEKQPAVGSGGIVAANHPLGAAAGAEMLAAGGNAVDAAVATLLSLTVVEPMMVGLLGGGMMQVRMSDGRHVVIDGQSQAPAAAAGPVSRGPLPWAHRPGSRRVSAHRSRRAPRAIAATRVVR